jgi:hypothetical protein
LHVFIKRNLIGESSDDLDDEGTDDKEWSEYYDELNNDEKRR